MSDDEKNDNVIPFPSVKEIRESGGPVSRVHKPARCDHYRHGYLVDQRNREVTCKSCKGVVDAFEALSSLTVHWDWDWTREEKKRVEKELGDLKRSLDAIKTERARVRRTGGVSVNSIRRAFDALIKEQERIVGMRRANGDKAAVNTLLFCIEQIKRTRVALLSSVEGE